MSKYRILIVDDDVISRKLLRAVLEKDADIEVVGLATHGASALTKIPMVKPDLVTLDVEMPIMDGLQTLEQIRKLWPQLPVIMYSAQTEAGAKITLDALEAGASDYVTKPEGRTLEGFPLKRLSEELLPKVHALCAPAQAVQPHASPQLRRSFPTPSPGKAPIDILTIGVSTGGPNALAQLVPQLDGNFPVPIVLVQHMPATFTRLLAERLDKSAEVRVVEAARHEELLPGTVYVAPGGYHMLVKERTGHAFIDLNQSPKVNSCRPAVDVLFQSVAEVYGPSTLNVILTGMGEDGLAGCAALSSAGGSILIQDEASSVVWGMPGAIAHSSIPYQEYPLSKIAGELNSRVAIAGQSTRWRAESA